MFSKNYSDIKNYFTKNFSVNDDIKYYNFYINEKEGKEIFNRFEHWHKQGKLKPVKL
jgi:hypothetical protein